MISNCNADKPCRNHHPWNLCPSLAWLVTFLWHCKQKFGNISVRSVATVFFLGQESWAIFKFHNKTFLARPAGAISASYPGVKPRFFQRQRQSFFESLNRFTTELHRSSLTTPWFSLMFYLQIFLETRDLFPCTWPSPHKMLLQTVYISHSFTIRVKTSTYPFVHCL